MSQTPSKTKTSDSNHATRNPRNARELPPQKQTIPTKDAKYPPPLCRDQRFFLPHTHGITRNQKMLPQLSRLRAATPPELLDILPPLHKVAFEPHDWPCYIPFRLHIGIEYPFNYLHHPKRYQTWNVHEHSLPTSGIVSWFGLRRTAIRTLSPMG